MPRPARAQCRSRGGLSALRGSHGRGCRLAGCCSCVDGQHHRQHAEATDRCSLAQRGLLGKGSGVQVGAATVLIARRRNRTPRLRLAAGMTRRRPGTLISNGVEDHGLGPGGYRGVRRRGPVGGRPDPRGAAAHARSRAGPRTGSSTGAALRPRPRTGSRRSLCDPQAPGGGRNGGGLRSARRRARSSACDQGHPRRSVGRGPRRRARPPRGGGPGSREALAPQRGAGLRRRKAGRRPLRRDGIRRRNQHARLAASRASAVVVRDRSDLRSGRSGPCCRARERAGAPRLQARERHGRRRRRGEGARLRARA